MSQVHRSLLLLAALSLPVMGELADAQDAAEDASESCDAVRCYQPSLIPLTLDDGTEVGFDLQSSVPIVSEDVVSLIPGANVFLKGDVVDGLLINLRPVVQPAELKDVLQLRMWQEPGSPDTYLKVINYFQGTLKYEAAMLVPHAEQFRATTTCAVLGDGRIGYELWQHAIFQIVLTNFSLAAAGATEATCQ